MPDLELRELAPHIYACLQPDRGLGYSNSGLVNRGGGLVIDTFWDLAHSRALLQQYARVWPEPARRVLNTHHNGDHCWGNQLLSGAEILGHRRCAEAFGQETPEAMQALRALGDHEDPALASLAQALADWDFSGIELHPPSTLFDQELTLDLDGVAVRLLYVGPAHTEGDVVAFLPEERVVFTGDVLFRHCTPIGWAGSFEGWRQALDTVAALGPEIVVPGHGPVCGPEALGEQRDYLDYVRREARALFEAGVAVEEAARRIDLGPYADWTEPERIVFNLDRAYRELRGEPYDAPIDAPALFRCMHALRGDPAFPRCGSAPPA